MADIFISYSNKDIERVRPLVEYFDAAGWTVFWDRDTHIGESWRQVIQSELADAGCVVAIWSENSVGSKWVIEEADEAGSQKKLISTYIDSTKLPFGYRHEQAADLSTWTGAEDDSVSVVHGIAHNGFGRSV